MTLFNAMLMDEFQDSTILVTGGTGFFGRRFIRMTLDQAAPAKIVVYSRDEMKQWEMSQQFDNDARLRFFLGDVRDAGRLSRACQDVDFIVHAAALKIIPLAEYNPFEVVKTNVLGAMNVIDCALNQKVRRVIALSTDKACSPVNLYGATKLCSDKLFVAANAYAGKQNTRFSVVRYGNVMGSRGSVIPLFRQQSRKGRVQLTDERMTRFMLRAEDAVQLVWNALLTSVGGEIFVRKTPSMRLVNIARIIAPSADVEFCGRRPGEKLHEQMITADDAPFTKEFPDHYVILPQIKFTSGWYEKYGDVPNCTEGFCYSSESNDDWLSDEQFRSWLRNEYEES